MNLKRSGHEMRRWLMNRSENECKVTLCLVRAQEPNYGRLPRMNHGDAISAIIKELDKGE